MSNSNPASRRFNILLVEDNDDDVVLTRHVFKKMSVPVEFQVARNGLEALELLRRSSTPNARLPDILLVDLNMPRMDGRQLLTELKNDRRFKAIPTIVLSTSSAADDVSIAYDRQASAYMTKPIALSEFFGTMQRFADFWLSGVAILPEAT